MIFLLFLFSIASPKKNYNEKLYAINRREPDQAALYSCLFPGAGSFYLGNANKGVGSIFATGGMIYLTIYFYGREEGPEWLGHLSLCGLIGLRIGEILGSYNDAKKYNKDLKRYLQISPEINFLKEEIGINISFNFD
jgi:hypothetical protein